MLAVNDALGTFRFCPALSLSLNKTTDLSQSLAVRPRELASLIHSFEPVEKDWLHTFSPGRYGNIRRPSCVIAFAIRMPARRVAATTMMLWRNNDLEQAG